MTVNHDVVGSSPTWGAITDRVIDTIYQLLYRFFMHENPYVKRNRQMIHTFTPSNQCATISAGGNENETFTRMKRIN